jgi:hypothetical protein
MIDAGGYNHVTVLLPCDSVKNVNVAELARNRHRTNHDSCMKSAVLRNLNCTLATLRQGK